MFVKQLKHSTILSLFAAMLLSSVAWCIPADNTIPFEFRATIEADWAAQEKRLGRTPSSPQAITKAIHASECLLADLGQGAHAPDLTEEQAAQRMVYVLQREEQEAARKRLEAAGIRDFQNIVAQGITSDLLTWKALEVQSLMAGSPNNTTVIRVTINVKPSTRAST